MGRTQRKHLAVAGTLVGRTLPRMLNDTSVDQSLDLDVPSGDPIAGVRNGVIGGLVIWALFALLLGFA